MGVLHYQDALYICSLSLCHVSGNIICDHREHTVHSTVEDWCFHLHHLTACLCLLLKCWQWLFFLWWNSCLPVLLTHSHGVSLLGSRSHHFLLLHCFWSSVSWSTYVRFSLLMRCVFPPGGVLLPSGVPGSHGGGGDAHQTGSGQGRTGEVSAVQRHLHRPQERKGRRHMKRDHFPQPLLNATDSIYLLHLISCFPFLALLFMSDQEVLPLYLVLHLPVLQKVNSLLI